MARSHLIFQILAAICITLSFATLTIAQSPFGQQIGNFTFSLVPTNETEVTPAAGNPAGFSIQSQNATEPEGLFIIDFVNEINGSDGQIVQSFSNPTATSLSATSFTIDLTNENVTNTEALLFTLIGTESNNGSIDIIYLVTIQSYTPVNSSNLLSFNFTVIGQPAPPNTVDATDSQTITLQISNSSAEFDFTSRNTTNININYDDAMNVSNSSNNSASFIIGNSSIPSNGTVASFSGTLQISSGQQPSSAFRVLPKATLVITVLVSLVACLL